MIIILSWWFPTHPTHHQPPYETPFRIIIGLFYHVSSNSHLPINVHQITTYIPNRQPLPYIHPWRPVFPDHTCIFLRPNQSVTLHMYAPIESLRDLLPYIHPTSSICHQRTVIFIKSFSQLWRHFVFLIFIRDAGLLKTENPIMIWCVYISIMQLFFSVLY